MSIKKLLSLVTSLATMCNFTIVDYCRAHKISKATFYRMLGAMRNDLKMTIICKNGHYQIVNFGFINKRGLLNVN